MELNKCRICDCENNTEEYMLREMMFGTREEFEYFKCSNCGCLQIKHYPENIQEYYPENYLTYPASKESFLKKYLLSKREKFLFCGRSLVGRILLLIFGTPAHYLWVREVNLNRNDSILEVGCGDGELLLKLSEVGFNNLLGIDPFIKNDIIYSKSLKILKRTIQQISDLQFNLIMFHHSFEHLDNPHETFEKVNKLLKNDGKVLIRIPVLDSFAWENYGANWVQLDPPRHLFLYSVQSIEYLVEKHGFVIEDIIYDSTALQFIGSEQYKRNIPFMSPNSYFQSSTHHIFSKEELKYFQKKADELNELKQGDSAGFLLKKIH